LNVQGLTQDHSFSPFLCHLQLVETAFEQMVQCGKADGGLSPALPGDRVVRVIGDVKKETLLASIDYFLADRLCAEMVADPTTQLDGVMFNDFVPLTVKANAYADLSGSYVVFKHLGENDAISFRKLVASTATFLRSSGQHVAEPALELDEDLVELLEFKMTADLDGDVLASEPPWIECIAEEVPRLAAQSAREREITLQVLATMVEKTSNSRLPLARAFATEHPTLLSAMISSIGTMSLREAYPLSVILQYCTSEASGAACMERFSDVLADAANIAQQLPNPIASTLAHAVASMAAHMIKPFPAPRSQHWDYKSARGEVDYMNDSLSGRTTACSMRPTSRSLCIEDYEWDGGMIDDDELSRLWT